MHARLTATALRQAGAVGQAYKATYRRLAYNLKDASNPDLRRRVLAREISGERLPHGSHMACARIAFMSPQYQYGVTFADADGCGLARQRAGGAVGRQLASDER